MINVVVMKVGGALLSASVVGGITSVTAGQSWHHSVTKTGTISTSVKDSLRVCGGTICSGDSHTVRQSTTKKGVHSTTTTDTRTYSSCTSTETVTRSTHYSASGTTTSYRVHWTPKKKRTKACGGSSSSTTYQGVGG